MIKVLKAFGTGAILTSDIVMGILESGYGASHWKMARNIEKRVEARSFTKEINKEKQKIYSTLDRLKKSGCIDAVNQGWKINKIGLAKLNKLVSANLPSKKYAKEESNTVKIITYDIPENRRRERAWLREKISNIGFNMMHQSVWIGKVKIPKEFLEDIKIIKLDKFIEIISINKSGDLEKLD